MVSKARLDLPDPDRPVKTIMESRGRSSETSLRLCSRAPRTTSRSATALSALPADIVNPGHGTPGHAIRGHGQFRALPRCPGRAACPTSATRRVGRLLPCRPLAAAGGKVCRGYHLAELIDCIVRLGIQREYTGGRGSR